MQATIHTARSKNIDPMHRMIRFIPIIGTLILLASTLLHAQVQEWPLLDARLHERTTLALQRYFTVVHPDSVRLRYLLRHAESLTYRIRGNHSAEDTLGELLSLGLGQILLYPSTNLHIALGEDLYEELALSRYDPTIIPEIREVGTDIGLDRWDAEHPLMVALDRVDYRFSRDLGAFVGVGAPESNLFWWSDGTFRAGVEGSMWEFALLLPYGAGATRFGFLKERLLAPAFGAAATARIGSIAGRIRFATPGEHAFISPLVATRTFVHTASGEVAWRGTFDTRYGLFNYTAGVGYEEFSAIVQDTAGESVPAGRVRRLSPVAALQWTAPGENFHVRVGVADIALQFGLSARLTDHLALDVYYIANDLLRDIKPFEHSSAFFLTPRLFF